jgi:hypothetical protein
LWLIFAVLNRDSSSRNLTKKNMTMYFMHHNFVPIHQKLKVTPAMAADHTPPAFHESELRQMLPTFGSDFQAMVCLVSRTNRTKMLHVKRFGTIAGREHPTFAARSFVFSADSFVRSKVRIAPVR